MSCQVENNLSGGIYIAKRGSGVIDFKRYIEKASDHAIDLKFMFEDYGLSC